MENLYGEWIDVWAIYSSTCELQPEGVPSILTSGKQRKYSITSIEFSVICLALVTKGRIGIFGHWEIFKNKLNLISWVHSHILAQSPLENVGN